VLKMLRNCGRAYKSNTLLSWRPHIVLCLGLCALPLDLLEKLMARSLRRFVPVLRGLVEKMEMEPPTQPPGEDAVSDADGATISSNSSSSDTSSDTSSGNGDEDLEEGTDPTTEAAGDQAYGPARSATGSETRSS